MAYELQHRTDKSLTKGAHFPLGASLTREGVNFAVYSQHAAEVFLLLFDAHDGEPADIIRLDERDKYIWHVHVKGLEPGQLYGYKVRGEYRPEWGLRFNDAKLLLDPATTMRTVRTTTSAGSTGTQPARTRTSRISSERRSR